MVVVLTILAALLLGFVAYRAARPAMQPARPTDPQAAKQTGQELLASRDSTFVVFTAHPDDAEFWSGGTLATLAKNNHVILVLGTSGDAGNGGFQNDMGAIREKLQLKAANVLGYSNVLFLRYKDGHLGEAAGYPDQVLELMRHYRPAATFSFDMLDEAQGYRHVDHEAAGRATLAAARAIGGQTLYLFQTGTPNVITDYSAVVGEKAKALTILWSYHNTGPLGFFWRWLDSRGLEQSALSRFSGRGYPEVGITYGETFHRVQP